MIIYWICKAILSLSFFDNLDFSYDIIDGIKTLIGYLYALDSLINIKLLFSLLLTFLVLLFIGLIAHVVIVLVRR